MKARISFLLAIFLAGILSGQEISQSLLENISKDFKSASLSESNQRIKHFSAHRNENSHLDFYLDSIHICEYFNNKSKSEIVEWLGEPDTIFYLPEICEYYKYELTPFDSGCKLHFTFGIPNPLPTRMPEPQKDQVITVGFECRQDCDIQYETEGMTVKYLVVKFQL